MPIGLDQYQSQSVVVYNICPRSIICAQISEMVSLCICLFVRTHISFDGYWSMIANINYETCIGHTRLWYSDQSCETWREKGFSFSPSSLPLSKSFLSFSFSSLAWKFHKSFWIYINRRNVWQVSNRCAPSCENLYAAPHKINYTLDN